MSLCFRHERVAPSAYAAYAAYATGLVCAVSAACSSLGNVGSAQFIPERDLQGQPAPVRNLDQIGVDEKLGETIPLDLTFRDHRGQTVTLHDYFEGGQKPVLITFAYHSCPMLCSLVLGATEKGLEDVEWTAGKEFRAITISIDPEETLESSAKKRAEILSKYGRDVSNVSAGVNTSGSGWDFLIADKDTIKTITQAMGYRYFYYAAKKQYAHPAAAIFLTPNAKVARYLYGIDFDSSDMRFALLEASEGRSISTVEHILMYCYDYDPSANNYTLAAFRIMQFGGLLTVLCLGAFFVVFLRKEQKIQARFIDPNLDPSPETLHSAEHHA